MADKSAISPSLGGIDFRNVFYLTFNTNIVPAPKGHLGVVPAPKGHLRGGEGSALKYFNMIHRGGQSDLI